jgi:hypothetical protein
MGGLDVEQIVNDVHSRLNATRVREIVRPARIDDVREAILRVKQEGPRTGGWRSAVDVIRWAVSSSARTARSWTCPT